MVRVSFVDTSSGIEAPENAVLEKFETVITKITQNMNNNMTNSMRMLKDTLPASEQKWARQLLDKSDGLFRQAVVAALKTELVGGDVLSFQYPKFIIHEDEPAWVRNLCQQYLQDFHMSLPKSPSGTSLARLCNEAVT